MWFDKRQEEEKEEEETAMEEETAEETVMGEETVQETTMEEETVIIMSLVLCSHGGLMKMVIVYTVVNRTLE